MKCVSNAVNKSNISIDSLKKLNTCIYSRLHPMMNRLEIAKDLDRNREKDEKLAKHYKVGQSETRKQYHYMLCLLDNHLQETFISYMHKLFCY